MDEDISLFIEPHSKNKNKWWLSLNSVANFYKTHKDVFSENAKNFFQSNTDIVPINSSATAKTCPAIGVGLLDRAFLIKAPCDIYISFSPEGGYYFDIKSMKQMNISSHPLDQFYSKQDNPFDGYTNIKFELPIILDAKNNDYLFLDAQYHKHNNPFKVVYGVINQNRKPLNVNVLFKIPNEITNYHIKAGTVLCYLWSPKKLKLKRNTNLKEKKSNKFFGNKLWT